jgi:hypothetical protein
MAGRTTLKGLFRKAKFHWPFLAFAGLLVVGSLLPAKAFFEKGLMTGDPFTLVASGTRAGGGRKISLGGKEIVMSFGGTAVAKMTGGDFEIGVDIVGGIEPSQANLDLAHAFPVPYIPSKGHASITFSNLSANATIRIYTLTGELVKELIKNDPASDRIAWVPVENEQGQGVASGVYMWVIESSDGQTKVGKLMIIK